MREHWFGGLSIILAGIAIAAGIVWAAGNVALRLRYTAVAVGDTVAVVDERTGSVQTFERSKQPPNQFAYVGTDSRALARDRAEAAAAGKTPNNPPDADE
jgi:hypothetical protein